MSQRLPITGDSDVYEGLESTVGEAGIGSFLDDLARPDVVRPDLEAGYAAMAADEARESEAEAWSDGLIGDAVEETRRSR